MMRYFSKLDNKSFANKDELIKHLVDNYSLEGDEQGDAQIVLKTFQEKFPYAEIDIEQLDKENKNGQYLLNMSWSKYNDAQFTFFIGESSESPFYYYQFNTVDEAVDHYNYFVEKAEEITKGFIKKYNAEDVIIDQMYDGDCNSSSGILINFVVDEVKYGGHFKLGSSVELFIDSFKGHFTNVIEGNVEKEKDEDSYRYDVEYYVDNVPVSTMFNKAKKIRIEVIE